MKKSLSSLFVALFAVFFFVPFAQAQWGATYGGTWADQAGSIRQTDDGGYIVGGTWSFTSGGDIWVLKLHGNGSVAWQKTYGGTGTSWDYNGRVRPTSDGGYIVAGNTLSFGLSSLDFWVLKLDGSGGVTWQKTYGGTESDYVNSVEEIGASGSYILAGTTESFGATDTDVWVLKLDSLGNITWQKTFDTGDTEAVFAIHGTDDGGCIMAGHAWSDTFGTSLNSDFWVLKLDADGNVGPTFPGTWQKIYGGADLDSARSIQTTADGGYVVAGESVGLEPGSEYAHAWVLKLTAGGDITWNQGYGSHYLFPQSIQPTTGGGYVMAGFAQDGPSQTLDDVTDAWVLKLDTDGDITWKKAYGGEESDHEDTATSIQQTSDSGYIMTGATESSGAGTRDVWALKLDGSGEIGDCDVVKTLASVDELDPVPTVSVAELTVVVTGTTISGSTTAATVVDTTAFQRDPCSPLVVAGQIDLPVTGQTECYGTYISEGVIDCAGTGQDGEHQMGVAWPVPRFRVNGAGTIITDRLTGLAWAADAGMPTLGDGACTGGGVKNWQGALDYIECLNNGIGSSYAGNYIGHDDWRLPNQNELFSLINVGYYDLVYTNSYWLGQQGFSTFTGDYWSSTTAVPYWDGYNIVSGGAWMVNSGLGNESPSDKDSHYRNYGPVRTSAQAPAAQLPRTGQTQCYDDEGAEIGCAGTGQDGEYQNGTAWPEPRFIKNSDATVTDRFTGLIWTLDARASEAMGGGDCDHCLVRTDGRAEWQEALDYVACLNGLEAGEGHLGHNDWRLPNVHELRSLVDFSRTDPALSAGHPFTHVDVSTYGYWTATTHFPGGAVSRAWRVMFGRYRVDLSGKTTALHVWPVRGGKQSSPPYPVSAMPWIYQLLLLDD